MNNEIESFIGELRSAPRNVQAEMLCHYRQVTEACKSCPEKKCPRRHNLSEVPDYTKDIDPLARGHYLVDTGKNLFFAVPNPECFYGMFCKVIRDLALGKYKDQFKEESDERA